MKAKTHTIFAAKVQLQLLNAGKSLDVCCCVSPPLPVYTVSQVYSTWAGLCQACLPFAFLFSEATKKKHLVAPGGKSMKIYPIITKIDASVYHFCKSYIRWPLHVCRSWCIYLFYIIGATICVVH